MYAALVLLAVGAAPPSVEVGGYYVFEGKTSKGLYQGMAMIIPVQEGVYVVQSVGLGSSEMVVGLGALRGRELVVGWSLGNVRGLSSYKIQGPTLRGKWISVPGPSHPCPETLRKVAPLIEFDEEPKMTVSISHTYKK